MYVCMNARTHIHAYIGIKQFYFKNTQGTHSDMDESVKRTTFFFQTEQFSKQGGYHLNSLLNILL